MCGIVGYVGKRRVVPVLLEGLKKLEYRGYDSAGIVYLKDGELDTHRCEGKLSKLEALVEESYGVQAYCGLGHTRWATHGAPTEQNPQQIPSQSTDKNHRHPYDGDDKELQHYNEVSQEEPLHRLALLYFVYKIHLSISFFLCVGECGSGIQPLVPTEHPGSDASFPFMAAARKAQT